MNLDPNTSVIIGIGNTGRSDDGIGWAMLDRLRANGYPGPCEYRYQLNVEDAEFISHFQTILLIDASQEEIPEGFKLEKVVPDTTFTYTTHSIPPATIAYLCRDIFGKSPDIYLLQVQGYNWEIDEGLTKEAKENTNKAFVGLLSAFLQPSNSFTTNA